jgi:hypothetical protein
LGLESLEDRWVPSVTYHGGPLLPHVEVQTLFYGSSWQTDPSMNQMSGQINGFFNSITNSTYLDQLQEYSEPGSVIGRGSLVGGRIGPVNLAAGQTITDQSIQGALNQYITTGGIVAPDPNRLYFVFTPPNVHVQTSDGENSITDFLGYHSSFVDTAGSTVYYAVVVHQSGNATLSGYSAFQQFTKVSSHELAEAITDPGGGSGWWDSTPGSSTNGEEIGDLCNSSAYITTLNGYTVQDEWSNLQFAATGNGALLLTSPRTRSFSMDGNGTIYELNTDSTLWHRDPAGNWALISGNVLSFALAPDGSVYDLTQSGQLWHGVNMGGGQGTWTPVGYDIQSFQVAPDGSVYDLTTYYGAPQLWHGVNMGGGQGAWTPVGYDIQSFQVAPDGSVYDLTQSGQLWHGVNMGGGQGSWNQIDQNVQFFVVNHDASVYYISQNGTHWRYDYLGWHRIG